MVGQVQGPFDAGYEAIRPEILAAQKELGLLPDDVELSPINPHGEPDATGPTASPGRRSTSCARGTRCPRRSSGCSPAWPRCSPASSSYTDDELGRVIDYLEESGQLDNTIVVVVSDNGASGEGGPNGSLNE